ncbi:MAG: serine/threonine-protein kinase [Oscillospiraceae bacterium]|nr:serine/threonine-protein kinase [Oscillospiraceae bacterium]
MKLCNACFEKYNDTLDMCPFCGYEEGAPPVEPYFLTPGMELENRYIIGKALGFGGFGITYKAWDKNLNIVVAVKEYYYTGIAIRVPGTQEVKIYAHNRREEYKHFLMRFLDEARYTAKFSSNNNIVNVYEFFEANSTAYMVMEFLEGTTLSEILKRGAIEFDECVSTMQGICSALKAVHDEGILHRDISPDNIMICSNGTVKLFDFGAARFSKNETQEMLKLTQVMKPGYSPPEQYQAISKQGPWTDIYALGATLYYMITGTKPEESTNRKTEDNLIPPNQLNPDIPDYMNDTILRAMAVDMHLRFSSVVEFEKALTKEKKVLGVVKEKKRRKKNRIIGLSAAVIALGIGLTIFIHSYEQQRLEMTLPDGEITIWFAVSEDEDLAADKIQAYEAIIANFTTDEVDEDENPRGFPNVTIEFVYFTYDEYTAVLREALEAGELPQLFESSGLRADILGQTTSVENALEQVISNEVLFFNQFDTVFPDGSQIPLGFIMPLLFRNSNPFEDDGAETDERARFLAGKSAEYVGTTADYYAVQDALAGLYSIEMLNSRDIVCTFTMMMSIGHGDDDQITIAERFLASLLGGFAQDFLHIQYQSGSLPLNRNILQNVYVPTYAEFRGFFDNVRNFDIR